MNKVWDWFDDLLEAAGGFIGLLLGFGLPMVAMGLAVYSLAHK